MIINRILKAFCNLIFSFFLIAFSYISCAYDCTETDMVCTQGKEVRNIDGIPVERECWQYSYTKTCDYPSKNNCKQLQDNQNCYLISENECLLRDEQGKCVNILRQYSCNMPAIKQKIRNAYLKKKDDAQSEQSSGIRCLNLPDYDPKHERTPNNEMTESIAKLSSVMQYKNLQGNNPASASQYMKNHKIFNGNLMYCNKNMLNFSNCCTKGGWGQDLFGASCSNREKSLSEMRDKKLCHYVGVKKKRVLGIVVNFQHYFCCFNNSLERIIQTDPNGRIRIRSFGEAENADCSGLTIDELQQIDFNKINFNDFEVELLQKVKMPNVSEINNRVENSLKKSIKQYKDKKDSGVNDNLKNNLGTDNLYHK